MIRQLQKYALQDAADKQYKKDLFNGQFKKIIGDYDSIVGALEIDTMDPLMIDKKRFSAVNFNLEKTMNSMMNAADHS